MIDRTFRVGVLLTTVAAMLGTAPPPVRASAPEIVLYASEAGLVKGHWATTATTSGAGGKLMRSSSTGVANTNAPLASPTHYFEISFNAPANTPYRVWLRLRAGDNSKWNDSVWMQFSDARVNGAAAYSVGTTSALGVNLERCGGCGVSGWGWANAAYWLAQATTVTFATTGTHTLRVQTREDGVDIDQIVLSPDRFLSSAPGGATNDSTTLAKTTTSTVNPAPPPPPGGSTPYTGTPFALPGTINAVLFDNGGQGVAYHDTTSGNAGGAFRATNVDIQALSADTFNVGWTTAGEWLAYSVNVAAPGMYAVQVRVSTLADAAVDVGFGSPSNALARLALPNTGGWEKWTTMTVPVALAAGRQVMTVRFPSGGVNLRSVSVTASNVTLAASGQTLLVTAGGDFQAALNAARPGDTILLDAGATFVGNFILPAKSGDSVITIRSTASDALLPPPGTRMTPAYARYLPKIRSSNTGPAIATAASAHHYLLQFLELQANGQGVGTILALGDGTTKQTSLNVVPHNLVVDRLYIHGDPVKGQLRGIALNSASTKILNSHISDIKLVNADTQAIAGWNGPGPFEITNNYLEGAGENVMFGGADPKIPYLVPSDITIRRNHIKKPLIWRSQSWTVKNLLELKNAQRVTIDGNIIENNWASGQAGYAVLFKSVNQEGTAPWSVVRQVSFTNNIVRNASGGMNISRVTGMDAIEINRITVRNNLFDNISRATFDGSGWFLLITGGADVVVDHNTIVNDAALVLVPDVYASVRFVFTNNVLIDRGYAVKGAGTAAGMATINKYFPSGQFFGGIYVGSKPADYPSANFYPPTIADVGFVDFATRNYRLSASSIYRGGATDGNDPGVDFDRLLAAQK